MKKISSSAILVYVTCPTKKSAHEIAASLITKRLAACANVLAPCESHCIWNGKYERSKEVPLILKTTNAKFNALKKDIRLLHPYDCPCIVSLSIEGADKDFVDWVRHAVC